MRLRALVYFTSVPCRSTEELFAARPSQNPKRRRLPLVNREAIPKELLQKNYFLTFVWGRGIASLLLVSLKK